MKTVRKLALAKTIKSGFAAGLLSLALSATAFAGGSQKVTFSPDFLFEEGNYIEGGIAYVSPAITGRHSNGTHVPNMGESYVLTTGALKLDLTDRLSFGFSTYQPIWTKVRYQKTAVMANPVISSLEARAYAALLKFDVDDNVSVYGGPVYATASGYSRNSVLPGIGLAHFEYGEADGLGFIAGAAYSKPEIAFRTSITYEKGIEFSSSTKMTAAATGWNFIDRPNSVYGTPSALEIALQTGIAENTLLIAGYRATWHDEANFYLMGANKASNFDTTETYKLGFGRRFTEKLSGSLVGAYEYGNGVASTSRPVDGDFSLTGGLKYALTDNIDVSLVGRYIWHEDNSASAPYQDIAFKDNTTWLVGTRIGYRF